jgi:hypothetical protein
MDISGEDHSTGDTSQLNWPRRNSSSDSLLPPIDTPKSSRTGRRGDQPGVQAARGGGARAHARPRDRHAHALHPLWPPPNPFPFPRPPPLTPCCPLFRSPASTCVTQACDESGDGGRSWLTQGLQQSDRSDDTVTEISRTTHLTHAAPAPAPAANAVTRPLPWPVPDNKQPPPRHVTSRQRCDAEQKRCMAEGWTHVRAPGSAGHHPQGQPQHSPTSCHASTNNHKAEGSRECPMQADRSAFRGRSKGRLVTGDHPAWPCWTQRIDPGHVKTDDGRTSRGIGPRSLR